jgi:hypothetical protein
MTIVTRRKLDVYVIGETLDIATVFGNKFMEEAPWEAIDSDLYLHSMHTSQDDDVRQFITPTPQCVKLLILIVIYDPDTGFSPIAREWMSKWKQAYVYCWATPNMKFWLWPGHWRVLGLADETTMGMPLMRRILWYPIMRDARRALSKPAADLAGLRYLLPPARNPDGTLLEPEDVYKAGCCAI